MPKTKILCSVGTRPEAIKMAPIIAALRAEPWAEVRVMSTGQHRELLDDILRVFEIEPDIDLKVMAPGQTLVDLTAKLPAALDRVLEEEAPAVALAQGDTTSVFMTALACFYRRVPFGHVEAGLRTGKRYLPFPEEMNRLLTTRLTTHHFAPTKSSRRNLLAEGVPDSEIYVTGNTVIDALYSIVKSGKAKPPALPAGKRLILMTAHRRENFGEPFREVCRGARDLADAFEDAVVLYAVHPNPNVGAIAREIMGGHPRIMLTPPLNYLEFIGAMNAATIIITDSGGVQEEAPALAKPVLVFRRETERPEAVEAGAAKLVGPDRAAIFEEGRRLMTDPAHYKSMAQGISPYGDGRATERIIEVLKRDFA